MYRVFIFAKLKKLKREGKIEEREREMMHLMQASNYYADYLTDRNLYKNKIKTKVNK